MPSRALRDVLAPTFQGLILADDFLKVRKVRGEVASREADLGHVFVAVRNRDPDRLEASEHIELGDVDAIEAVDECGILHERDVKPSAAAPAACCGAILMADLLEHLPDLHLLPCRNCTQTLATHLRADVLLDEICKGLAFVLQFRGEGPMAHARRVGFHHANDVVNFLGRHAESCADAPDCCVRGRHERVRPKVDVEESRVRALDEHLVAPRNVLVD
mmetsp:Transcript_48920/g.136931  ORF Transcript_48920/g.136931 Transcript_48920/m.136931 type:complete len:218 (+) Transcript_48920:368-1021(+)